MALPERSSHPSDPAICRTCLTRDCCSRRVPLTLPELARIARTLSVPPSSFAELGAPISPSPTPLRTPSLERAQVLLRHVDSSCIFLLHLGSGRRFCGLGPLAPAACTHFPGPRDLEDGKAPPCPYPWPNPLALPPPSAHDSLVAASDGLYDSDDPPNLPDAALLDALLALTP
jgi:hypothetical protein